jgi:hypothetical protein
MPPRKPPPLTDDELTISEHLPDLTEAVIPSLTIVNVLREGGKSKSCCYVVDVDSERLGRYGEFVRGGEKRIRCVLKVVSSSGVEKWKLSLNGVWIVSG